MIPNYARPIGTAEAKPERQRYVKNRAKGKRKLTRAQVLETVYRREKMICQRCKRRCKRPKDCTWEGDPAMANVNELVPRSKGGDPLKPEGCELVCQECHMPNGEHAPTEERMQVVLKAAEARRLLRMTR